MSKHEEIQNDAMTSAVRAWSSFVIRISLLMAHHFNLAGGLRDYDSTNQVALRT
jgi:hypothetical protein